LSGATGPPRSTRGTTATRDDGIGSGTSGGCNRLSQAGLGRDVAFDQLENGLPRGLCHEHIIDPQTMPDYFREFDEKNDRDQEVMLRELSRE